MKGGMKIVLDAMEAIDAPTTLDNVYNETKSLNHEMKKEEVSNAVRMAISRGLVQKQDNGRYALDKKMCKRRSMKMKKARKTKTVKQMPKVSRVARKASLKVSPKKIRAASVSKGLKHKRSGSKGKKSAHTKTKSVKRTSRAKKCDSLGDIDIARAELKEDGPSHENSQESEDQTTEFPFIQID